VNLSIAGIFSLARTRPNVAPEDMGMILAGAALLSLLSVALAVRLRLYRLAAAAGPAQMAPGESGIVLAVMLLGVLAAFFGVAGLAIGPLEQTHGAAGRLIATALGMSAAVGLVVGLSAFYRRDGLRLMGFDGGPIALRGSVLVGLLAAVIAFPWVFWTALGSSALLAPQQPAMHEIFEAWADADATWRILAVFSAVVVAPVGEEVIFRGLLQRIIWRIARKFVGAPPTARPESSAAPQSLGPEAAAPVPDSSAVSLSPARLNSPSPVCSWVAILVASLLFALTHRPPAIVPPIFILSLALGYVYERTGSLPAVMVMHAAFNAAQFALFLSLVS